MCGDGLCDATEDSCSCAADCPDDPDACSPCECGDAGGNCYCDEACFGFGDCCANVCEADACEADLPMGCGGGGGGDCGNGNCDPGEDSCSCAADCPDDPASCSACECGGAGGDCYCDEDCFNFGDCCTNVCDPGVCDTLMGC